MNKKNYLAPWVEIEIFHEDIVTASIPEEVDGVESFDKNWIN